MLDDADDGVLRSLIRDVPDFPEPGILFKNITPLLADAEAFALVVDRLSEHFVGQHSDKVVGVEARGFVLAAPVAHRLGAGLVPVRKPGELPWDTHAATYDLEYERLVGEVVLDPDEPITLATGDASSRTPTSGLGWPYGPTSWTWRATRWPGPVRRPACPARS